MIFFEELRRYLDALPPGARIEIEIRSKGGARTVEAPVTDYFARPLRSEIHEGCPEEWYLYGNRLFSSYQNPDKDTYSLNKGDENEIYIRSENYGKSHILLVANAVRRYRNPAVYFYEQAKSFLYFELPRPDTALFIKSAVLNLEVAGGYVEKTGDPFEMHRINEPWSEENLTWNNESGISGKPITFVSN